MRRYEISGSLEDVEMATLFIQWKNARMKTETWMQSFPISSRRENCVMNAEETARAMYKEHVSTYIYR